MLCEIDAIMKLERILSLITIDDKSTIDAFSQIHVFLPVMVGDLRTAAGQGADIVFKPWPPPFMAMAGLPLARSMEKRRQSPTRGQWMYVLDRPGCKGSPKRSSSLQFGFQLQAPLEAERLGVEQRRHAAHAPRAPPAD